MKTNKQLKIIIALTTVSSILGIGILLAIILVVIQLREENELVDIVVPISNVSTLPPNHQVIASNLTNMWLDVFTKRIVVSRLRDYHVKHINIISVSDQTIRFEAEIELQPFPFGDHNWQGVPKENGWIEQTVQARAEFTGNSYRLAIDEFAKR